MRAESIFLATQSDAASKPSISSGGWDSPPPVSRQREEAPPSRARSSAGRWTAGAAAPPLGLLPPPWRPGELRSRRERAADASRAPALRPPPPAPPLLRYRPPAAAAGRHGNGQWGAASPRGRGDGRAQPQGCRGWPRAAALGMLSGSAAPHARSGEARPGRAGAGRESSTRNPSLDGNIQTRLAVFLHFQWFSNKMY